MSSPPNRLEKLSPARKAIILLAAIVGGIILVKLGFSVGWMVFNNKNIYAETWPIIK